MTAPVLGVGVEPAETKWGFPRGAYLSRVVIKEWKAVEVRRIAGHRVCSGCSSSFHLLCQMRLLAEMFDFHINTILPLHCAEAAFHVKPIWNYEWWFKLWLIGLVIPVYTLFIPLQLMHAASLYFLLCCVLNRLSGVLSEFAYKIFFPFTYNKWISTRTHMVLLFFMSFLHLMGPAGAKKHAESANFHKSFISDFCFPAKLDKDMCHSVLLWTLQQPVYVLYRIQSGKALCKASLDLLLVTVSVPFPALGKCFARLWHDMKNTKKQACKTSQIPAAWQ